MFVIFYFFAEIFYLFLIYFLLPQGTYYNNCFKVTYDHFNILILGWLFFILKRVHIFKLFVCQLILDHATTLWMLYYLTVDSAIIPWKKKNIFIFLLAVNQSSYIYKFHLTFWEWLLKSQLSFLKHYFIVWVSPVRAFMLRLELVNSQKWRFCLQLSVICPHLQPTHVLSLVPCSQKKKVELLKI